METVRRLSQHIRVYNGYGISEQSLKMIMKSLPSITQEWHIPVREISAEEIREGHWPASTRLLVIGGGFDRGYLQSLGEQGTTLISSYVNGGGAYLGICAGAYFGCREIEFAARTELEVKGSRPLRFFDGFRYNSEDGAHAPLVERTDCRTEFSCYYNGGGHFQPNSDSCSSNAVVLAKYVGASNQAAAVMCSVGKGRAILSGIHFEYDEEMLVHGAATDSASSIDSTHPRILDLLPSLRSSRSERLQFYRDIVGTLLGFNAVTSPEKITLETA